MRQVARKIAAISGGILLFGATAYAYANPGVALCALADVAPRVGEGELYVDLVGHDEKIQRVIAVSLIDQARGRIKDTFGATRSDPRVLFWSDDGRLAKFNLSRYATAHFVGTRACVVVGPSGRNVDVVAHELMHVEIFERVGVLGRATQVPTWFDEGLAMQVDYRTKYDLALDAGTGHVRDLKSYSEFFSGNAETMTLRYGAAKVEVREWVNSIGASAVLDQLGRVGAGERFATILRGSES